MLLILLASCSSTGETIFNDLSFGMTHDEVMALGYCSNEKSIEEGFDTYQCTHTNYIGLNFESIKIHFINDELSKISLYNSTKSPDIQRNFSGTIRDYLVPKYGEPKDVGKCYGWKDDNVTFIQHIHCDFDSTWNEGLIYKNELVIFSNQRCRK
jgi:hypothetical protein